MNFNSLSSNEKLAVFASIATIIGALLASFLAALTWFGLLAGVAMLIVIFLPQLSSGTQLPGSKGGIMFLVGLIAGVASVLSLLTLLPNLGAYMEFYPLQTLFLLVAVAGGLVLAWVGWQEFQSGGRTWDAGGPRTAGVRESRADVPPAAPPPSTGSTGSTGMGSSSSMGGSTGAGGASGAATGSGWSSPGGSTSADTAGMGSTGSASTTVGSTSAGSTDMGADDAAARVDEEEEFRNR